MVRVPFFHYTHFDNLEKIIDDGMIKSREYKNKEEEGSYKDISINERQEIRKEKGLTDYIPLFAGFYTKWRNYPLNGYLQREYDDPKVQNTVFYGSLNKHIRDKLGEDYESVIIMMIKHNRIYELIDEGNVLLYDTIAIRSDSNELRFSDKDQFLDCLENCIIDSSFECEVDILYDEKNLLRFPDDVEIIIVDNEEIENKVNTMLMKKGYKIPVYINPLLRDKTE
jgi:hypothetical protein